MQKCAVVVPDEEVDWVLNNGIELGGVSLPSLRRLFQIAVGDDLVSAVNIQTGIENTVPGKSTPKGEAIAESHVTRTLGHHKDTPALAPLLGRETKRRRICSSEDLGLVDITKDEIKLSPLRPIWRMPFAHRNVAKPSLDIIPDLNALCPPDALPLPSSRQRGKEDTTGSRFHIVARVVISDHSLWFPPGEYVALLLFVLNVVVQTAGRRSVIQAIHIDGCSPLPLRHTFVFSNSLPSVLIHIHLIEFAYIFYPN